MAKKRPPSLLGTLRFIAFAATLLGSGTLVSTILFYNSSLPASGIILDFAPNRERFSPETTPIIAYIDYRNQKRLGAPISALGTVGVLLGQKAALRYDANRPEVFRIDTLLGMWGAGVIRILYGLVPFLVLGMLAGRRAPARVQKPAASPRSSTLKPQHLIRHKSAPTSDSGVVRRMR